MARDLICCCFHPLLKTRNRSVSCIPVNFFNGNFCPIGKLAWCWNKHMEEWGESCVIFFVVCIVEIQMALVKFHFIVWLLKRGKGKGLKRLKKTSYFFFHSNLCLFATLLRYSLFIFTNLVASTWDLFVSVDVSMWRRYPIYAWGWSSFF